MENLSNQSGEFLGREWLAKEMGDVERGMEMLGVVVVDVRRSQDDFTRVASFTKVVDQVASILFGHSPVGDHEIKPAVFSSEYIRCFRAIFCEEGFAVGLRQDFECKSPREILVVHKENAFA